MDCKLCLAKTPVFLVAGSGSRTTQHWVRTQNTKTGNFLKQKMLENRSHNVVTVLPRETGSFLVNVENEEVEESTDEIVDELLQNDSASEEETVDISDESLYIEELVMESDEDGATFEEIEQSFPYKLDKFQSISIQQLLSGKSVVVCAPTGAGKTAIADAAALACLSKGKRAIYTTPLKALSNQKLLEFRTRFGSSRTGLVTGDTTIRSNAQIIVMTTEILRNMFYDVESTAPGVTERLRDVGLIVLDEVHYLGIPGRGSVWEEVIVGCPKHIQMLCMSATVANPQDLGDWISQIHGPCVTVKTSKRPVPLSWFFAFSSAKRNRADIHPLLTEDNTKVNPVCVYEQKPSSGFSEVPIQDAINPASMVPSLSGLIFSMQRENYLPAIIFVFSRADCDRKAVKMFGHGVCLTTTKEQAAIKQALKEVREDQPEAIREKCVGALVRGIATHHAGCLPAWKVLIETLFQNGYLKVVFATGTLAAGINMPARTTVLTALARRTADGMAHIGHNELLQMAGRAGRRGFDTVGNCIILQSKQEGAVDAFSILKSGTEPIKSQLRTGYSFVLNLLARFTLDEAKSFLEKSFRSYVTGVGLVKREEQIKSLEQELEELTSNTSSSQSPDSQQLSSADEDVLMESYKEIRSKLTQLIKAAKEERVAKVEKSMENLEPPFAILLDTTKNALGYNTFSAMCLKVDYVKKGSGSVPLLLCLGRDNTFYKAPMEAVLGIKSEGDWDANAWIETTKFACSKKITWSKGPRSVKLCKGPKSTTKMAFTIPSSRFFERISWSPATDLSIKAHTAQTKKLKKRMKSQEKEEVESEEQITSQSRAITRIRRQLKTAHRLKKELESEKDVGWQGFQQTVATLIHAGQAISVTHLKTQELKFFLCIEGALEEKTLAIRPLGHVARELYGDNELWLATAFTHESVQLLTPATLSALVSAFVTPEVCSRPGIFFNIPPPKEVVQILDTLHETRSALYQYEVTSGAPNPQALFGLEVDVRAAGLVEAWTSGCTWDQIVSSTNIDDGDLARLLLRARDLLRQIMTSNYLLESLRASASRAQRAMNRKPIRDLF